MGLTCQSPDFLVAGPTSVLSALVSLSGTWRQSNSLCLMRFGAEPAPPKRSLCVAVIGASKEGRRCSELCLSQESIAFSSPVIPFCRGGNQGSRVQI